MVSSQHLDMEDDRQVPDDFPRDFWNGGRTAAKCSETWKDSRWRMNDLSRSILTSHESS